MAAWSPQDYVTNARFVAELGRGLIDLLAQAPGPRVLDLGCGDGRLTLELIDAGFDVLAVDADPAMVAATQALGIDALQTEGETLDGIDGPFDAVFSNAALHWMDPLEDAIERIAEVLVPGGLLVAEFGGFGNIAAIRTALHAQLRGLGLDPMDYDPWTFPSEAEMVAMLEEAGLEPVEVVLFPRPTRLPTDLAGWLRTFAGALLDPLKDRIRTQVVEQVVTLLEPILQDDQDGWVADYVRLRVVARKPGWAP